MKRIIRTLVLLALLLCVAEGYAQQSQMETDYNRIAERFEARDKSLQKDLKTYLQKYPYTTYEDEIHFMSGVLQA